LGTEAVSRTTSIGLLGPATILFCHKFIELFKVDLERFRRLFGLRKIDIFFYVSIFMDRYWPHTSIAESRPTALFPRDSALQREI
jgi:hypothetical protein